MDGSGRRRILIGGVALLGLVAAVGLASRAHTPTGGGQTRGLNSGILLEYLLLLMVAAAVVIVPATIYLFVVGKGEEDVVLPPRRNWMLALFGTMGVVALVSVVLLVTGYFRNHHGGLHSNPLTTLMALARGGARAQEAVPFDWAPVIVVSSLTVAGITAAALMLVRRREPKAARPRVAAELARALDADARRVARRPRCTPRRDRRLRADGAGARPCRAPRRPSEAPREYLQRALPAVGAGAGSIERG